MVGPLEQPASKSAAAALTASGISIRGMSFSPWPCMRAVSPPCPKYVATSDEKQRGDLRLRPYAARRRLARRRRRSLPGDAGRKQLWRDERPRHIALMGLESRTGAV